MRIYNQKYTIKALILTVTLALFYNLFILSYDIYNAETDFRVEQNYIANQLDKAGNEVNKELYQSSFMNNFEISLKHKPENVISGKYDIHMEIVQIDISKETDIQKFLKSDTLKYILDSIKAILKQNKGIEEKYSFRYFLDSVPDFRNPFGHGIFLGSDKIEVTFQ